MKKRTAKPKAQKKSEVGHYNAVLVEGLRDEFRMVTEAVVATREELVRRIDGAETQLGERITDVETGIRVLNKRVETLDGKIDGVEARLGERIAGVQTELVETRQELSGKIDKISVRLDQHDGEISYLKQSSVQ